MEQTKEYEIGKDIFITSKILRRYIDNLMPCDAVTGGQGRVLGLIIRKAEAGEDLYQRDIETEFQIRGSSVTSTLQLMEKRGLIRRESSAEDARRKKILPTEEGLRVHDEIHENIIRAEEKMISLFSEQEISVFRTMMEQLRELTTKGEEDTMLC